MKAYVKTTIAICTDPECCGGSDYVSGVTLSEKVAEKWKNQQDTEVEEFELTEDE